MTRSPTEAPARELLHVVMLVMRSVSADMRRSEKPLAPGQLGTLMRIAAGPCTMSSLARHLAVSLPTVSKAVDILVRRRLVERSVDEQDRRQTLIRLTPEGRRASGEMRKQAERYVAAALAPLSAEELTALVDVLAALKRVLALPEPKDGIPPHRARRSVPRRMTQR